jgi:hypothetical protein
MFWLSVGSSNNIPRRTHGHGESMLPFHHARTAIAQKLTKNAKIEMVFLVCILVSLLSNAVCLFVRSIVRLFACSLVSLLVRSLAMPI